MQYYVLGGEPDGLDPHQRSISILTYQRGISVIGDCATGLHDMTRMWVGLMDGACNVLHGLDTRSAAFFVTHAFV